MRFRSLRSVLQKLALASLPATRAMQGCCPPAADPIEQAVQVDPRDEVFAPLLDRCRANDLDCTALCTKVLARLGEDVEGVMFSMCRIHDRSSMRTDIDLAYVYPYDCVAGRRPVGLAGGGADAAGSPLGAWLARTARLEAASVHAFAALAADLAATGAPDRLVHASLRAADDEIRHARTTALLARIHGGRPQPPEVAARAPQELAALAAHNAAEGCMRETFGALVATRQALAATDPGVRAALRVIAAEETGHAALAAAIDRWARPRLSERERAGVDRARAAALAELLAAPGGATDPELARLAGLPDEITARALARSTAMLQA